MLKALFKKQFLELNAFYFQDKKTGKHRSKAGTAGYILLYIFLFCVLGFTFFMSSSMLAEAFVPMGLGWLYFSLMGILAVFLGVFGGVFNTYAALYRAKDNELLLSMPIPPLKILLVRMSGVYAMGLLYESLVFLPTAIAYFVVAGFSAGKALCLLVLLFLLGFLVLTLTCFFGWIVALLAGKLKNKSAVTVLLSLVLFGIYYWLCFNYYSFFESLILMPEKVGSVIKGGAYPLYLFGLAAEGNLLALLGFGALVAALAALTAFILSKTFYKIALKKEDDAPKAVYKEENVTEKSLSAALFRKEWLRFSKSATYMLNCSLGTVFMVLMAGAALYFSADIREILGMFDLPPALIAILSTVGVCTIASMNDIAAPSVSLEGRSLWVLQSLPVPAEKILNAKQLLHWALTMPPALLLDIALQIVLKTELSLAVLSAVFVLTFVLFHAALGLFLDLQKPNLIWTNETVPIKQSLSVTVALFGGWVLAIAFGALGFFLLRYVSGEIVLIGGLLLLALSARLLNRWIKTTGASILASL